MRAARFILQSAAALLAIMLLAAPMRPAEAATVEEVSALHAQYLAAFNHRDAAGLAALFSEDAYFVSGDGAVFKGRAAIEAMFASGFTEGAPVLDFSADHVEVFGDGAWDIGHGGLTAATGAPQRTPFHYAAIYRHDGGTLKVRAVLVGTE